MLVLVSDFHHPRDMVLLALIHIHVGRGGILPIAYKGSLFEVGHYPAVEIIDRYEVTTKGQQPLPKISAQQGEQQ